MAYQWQSLADKFQVVINEMHEIVNDPNSPPQDQGEARQTIVEIQAYLRRLQILHNVVPGNIGLSLKNG